MGRKSIARFYLKLSLFVLLVLFCILFGVSLATKGIKQVQGPMTTAAVKNKPAADKPKESPVPIKAAAASASKSKPSPESKTAEKLPAVEPAQVKDSSMNRLGNKLGSLLQIAAHHGIRLFVSMFDAVLGKGEAS